MTQRGATLVVVLAAVMTTGVRAQDVAAPFVVGVWGQGDAILPFAEFDGRQWRSSWPAAVDTQPDPVTLQRIPAAWWGRSTFHPIWELLEPGGTRRRVRITSTGFAALGSSCSINHALETDVPANTFEYGTVLAADRPGVIDSVKAVVSNSFEWASVSALLPGIYRDYETQAWKDVPTGYRPDFTAPMPGPTLDAVFMATDEAGQYVYFESSRRFPRSANQAALADTFITGWLWRSPATPFQSVTVQAGTRDEDGKGTPSFHPLGVVRQGTQRFWLGTLSSYAYSGLTVVDVSRGGIRSLLVVDYPGC